MRSIDEDGLIITEAKCKRRYIVLEQYYLDSDNNWVYDDIDTQGELWLCLYLHLLGIQPILLTAKDIFAAIKVKMDMSTVPEGFVPTKYRINNGNSDSDLPLAGT